MSARELKAHRDPAADPDGADRRLPRRLVAAFRAIGDVFLVVFLGIFLALVFEYPVRFVMAKTRLSRGLAATLTVIGARSRCSCIGLVLLVPLVGSVRDFLHDLPQTIAQLQDADELSWLDTGIGGTSRRARSRSRSRCPDAISAVLGIAGDFFGVFLACFTILFICIFLLTDIERLKRALASVLMPGDDARWLNVWELVTVFVSRWAIGVVVIAVHRRDDAGRDGLDPRLELRGRARRDRGAARHDPEHRRDHRRLHPRADHLLGKPFLELIDGAVVEERAEHLVHVVRHAVIGRKQIVESFRLRGVRAFASHQRDIAARRRETLDQIPDLSNAGFIVALEPRNGRHHLSCVCVAGAA